PVGGSCPVGLDAHGREHGERDGRDDPPPVDEDAEVVLDVDLPRLAVRRLFGHQKNASGTSTTSSRSRTGSAIFPLLTLRRSTGMMLCPPSVWRRRICTLRSAARSVVPPAFVMARSTVI